MAGEAQKSKTKTGSAAKTSKSRSKKIRPQDSARTGSGDDDNNNNIVAVKDKTAESADDHYSTDGIDDENNNNDNDNNNNGIIPSITLAVFGMSTEGYEIARRAAVNGASVFIVDESNLTAILLNAEIARTYPDISTLQEDEPIMSFIPLQEAVSKSDLLFFAPRIRTQAHNIKANTQSLFKDAVESVKVGASVVFCVPVGIGGNSEYISILQHETGLEMGSEVLYYYYPIEDGRNPPKMIGSADTKQNPALCALLRPPEPAGEASDFSTLAVSEYSHAMDVISRFAQISTAVEFGQFVPDEIKRNIAEDPRVGDLYIDGMIGGMLDLRLLELSLVHTKPLQRLASLYGKIIDSYVTRFVERIRQIVRRSGMRTTKTKMIVLWSFDPHLLRGDRNMMMQILIERLRDWLADVEFSSEMPRGILASDLPIAILPCTSRDFETALRAQKEKPTLLVIKATPLCDVVPNKNRS